MPARRATSDHHEPASPSRRRALKTAAATGAAALVWTEPTIKGLARRPAYADAGSSTTFEEGTVTPISVAISLNGTASLNTTGSGTLTLTLLDSFAGPVLTAVRADDGCACNITSENLTLTEGFAGTVEGAVNGTGGVQFDPIPGVNFTLAGSFAGSCGP